MFCDLQNSSVGSPVFQVMATDPDDPNTPNGRISYRFLDDGLDAVAFNIGENTFIYFSQPVFCCCTCRCAKIHNYNRTELRLKYSLFDVKYLQQCFPN